MDASCDSSPADSVTIFVNNCGSYDRISFFFTDEFDDHVSYGDMITRNGGADSISTIFPVKLPARTFVYFSKGSSLPQSFSKGQIV
jgi:hypothetical protein